jgi:hypothetical protein
MIINAMALPLGPPSSINCLARSTPIDSNAASADEKNAAAIKQITRPRISLLEDRNVISGSM